MSHTILAISGSLRKGSRNTALLKYAQAHAPDGLTIELADLSEVPFYNADKPEPPASVRTLFGQMERASGLMLGCAEYNYSIAPALKNALDWASREKDNRLLAGKTAVLAGCRRRHGHIACAIPSAPGGRVPGPARAQQARGVRQCLCARQFR